MQTVQATVVVDVTQPIQAATIVQPSEAFFCSQCGNALASGSRFCNKCGAPTAAVGPAPTAGSAGAPSTARFDLKLDLTQKTPKLVPPEVQSMGVDQRRWDKWEQDIEAGKRQNPFYSCPPCEGCYWCCPLLCIQQILCAINPCSWWLISRNHSGLNHTKNAINSDIENEKKVSQSLQDLHYGWKEGFMGRIGVFYTGPKPTDLT